MMVFNDISDQLRPLMVRVASGTPDGQQLASVIWRIWQGKKNDDIYIAARNVAGDVKCSLHANRYCYVGYTSQFIRRQESKGLDVPSSREWINWTLPPTPDDNFLFAAEIWLPAAPLYKPDKPVPHPTFLIEPPPPGRATIIYVVYSRMPKGEPLITNDVIELGYSQLKSGDYVAVFCKAGDFDYLDFEKSNMPQIRESFIQHGPKLPAENQTEPQDLRMFTVNNPKIEGRLKILDIAVRWTPGTASSVEIV